MTQQDHVLIKKVAEARIDNDKAGRLIEEYLPFIKAEAARNTRLELSAGVGDELSVATFAFYEAIGSYDSQKGAFLSYASLIIRSRLSDYYRKETRYRRGLTSGVYTDEDGDEISALEKHDSGRRYVEEKHDRQAAAEEIGEFAKTLAKYGLSLTGVAENCPKQERTFRACKNVVEAAKRNPILIERLTESGKLPVAELAALSGADKKTIERHRRYIVALLLAFTNGFEIIRNHIRQVGRPVTKGGKMA